MKRTEKKMKWTKLTLTTTTDAVDLVSHMLHEMGIEGVEIHDNVPLSEVDKQKLFVDILPELAEDDGTAKISFYLEGDSDIDDTINKVQTGLKEIGRFVPLGSGQISIDETEDEDWLNNWKQFFKPFRIDDDIIIKPTWVELEELRDQDIVIEIDPGISFGTGSHETTKLCIIALKKYVKADSVVLDAGCGSGILSIIAKKLSAHEVLGIDIDPMAVETAMENAKVNGLNISEGNLDFIHGNIIEDGGVRENVGQGKYDIVVANILADVIIPLSDVIGENLKSGGIFIVSGIINTKEEEVRRALLKNNFDIIEVNKMGDWVSFVAQHL